jgi:hypothetical protein
MVEALLQTLIDKAVDEGMRTDSGYREQVWPFVIDAVSRAVGGQPMTEGQCKSKHDSCKEGYELWLALTGFSGFAQGPDGGVLAETQVLTDYFIAHPKAGKFRTKPLEFDNLHWQLFHGIAATGQDAMTIENLLGKRNEFDGQDGQLDAVDGCVERDGMRIEPSVAPEFNALHRKRAGTQSISQAVKKRGKKGTSVDHLEMNLGRIVDGVDRLVRQMGKDCQRDAIIKFMGAYQALDDQLKWAILNLFEKEFLAKIFISLRPRSIQRSWVKRQLDTLSTQAEFEHLGELVEGVNWDGESDKLKSKD